MKFLFSLTIFCFQLFSNPYETPFSEETFEVNDKKVAVISGAGPAGLVAAKTLLKAGFHDLILIVENRTVFNRINLLSFFPESWPMIKNLGIEQEIRSVATLTSHFSFYFDYGKGAQKIFIVKENAPETFDYRGKISEIFKSPRVGLHIAPIADIQRVLAHSLSQNPKVIFIKDSDVVSTNPDKDGFHQVRITYNRKEIIFTPDLIIVAEGAHSKTRSSIGIEMQPMLKKQLWCSGVIPLKNWQLKDPFVELVEKQHKNALPMRAFGIFMNQSLFLNGQTLNAHESVKDCLVRNALGLLKRVFKNDENLIDHLDTTSVGYSQELLHLVPSKADGFTSGKNLIFTGDANGHATPKGGIGFSLILSVYQQALLDMLEKWPQDREGSIGRYGMRISAIIDYWLGRIATDDLVL